MAENRDKFIADLVASHVPAAPLPRPVHRALLWLLTATAFSATMMWVVQPFRPGFAKQLIEHPRLLVEVLSALLCVAWGAYITFVSTTPGERLTRAVRVLAALTAGVFVVSLVASFVAPSPESSELGERHHCWLEVFAFGGASLGLMLFMARKAYLRFSSPAAAMIGLAAGLVPASLMQIACMYDPRHALEFHYGPILLLVVIGAWLVKRFEE